MSSMSAIPPTHVPSASLLQQSPTRKSTEWPALASPSKKKDHNPATNDAVDESWEMLPDDDHDATSPQTSFCVVEPLQDETDNNNTNNNSNDDDNNVEKRCSLMHSYQSTPDFHNYETILEETDNVEAILIEHEEEEEDDEEGCDGSSSMVMVSGPPSVLSESCWSSGGGGSSSSSKISFRDAIMKKQTAGSTSPGTQGEVQPKMIKKKKPKFVVSPIKRCAKSTGDLRSLARIAESNIHLHHDDDGGGFGGGGGGGGGGDEIIVGDTDAELFYNQKAKGKVGRKNGKKIRPDEKKRLLIIMAKKDDQRQRQQQSQPSSQAAEKKGKKNKKDELK